MDLCEHVAFEMEQARVAHGGGDASAAFRHLERAHILGQASTRLHVKAHFKMLGWAVRQRDLREFYGQVFRIVGAATKTVFGLVPIGNTGGSNVSPFKPMPIPDDLAAMLKNSPTIFS